MKSTRVSRTVGRIRQLIRAIDQGDDAMVEKAVRDLSQSRRYLAPLAFLVGAFAMLLEGVKLLIANWRLTLIEVLPAMLIWIAMMDLKEHVFHGKQFNVVTGPVVIPLILGVALITAASYYLNAVFAFSIAEPGEPQIHRGFVQARAHLGVVLAWGASVGLCLGVATIIFPRWGRWWFAVSLSIVIGVMMMTYVAVPSRVVGIKTTRSTRDKLSATAVAGTVGAIVCTPPYALGRLGILMLGSSNLFILGIVALTVGLTLQAGASGAIKAIKMSAKLVSGRDQGSAALEEAGAEGSIGGASLAVAPPSSAPIPPSSGPSVPPSARSVPIAAPPFSADAGDGRSE